MRMSWTMVVTTMAMCGADAKRELTAAAQTTATASARQFLVDNERGKSMQIEIAGIGHVLPATGADGHAETIIEVPTDGVNAWLSAQNRTDRCSTPSKSARCSIAIGFSRTPFWNRSQRSREWLTSTRCGLHAVRSFITSRQVHSTTRQRCWLSKRSRRLCQHRPPRTEEHVHSALTPR